MASARRLLAVVRWPLGGIRTYMRHVYGGLGRDWSVTILASDTQETQALQQDAREIGAELVISRSGRGGGERALLLAVLKLMATRRFDLVQSQGFISAVLASLANIVFRVPHVVTVHGILEERLLGDFKGRLKLAATRWALKSCDAVYCVGEDILSYLRLNMPGLNGVRPRLVAIPNGIETSGFGDAPAPGSFREEHGIGAGTFLFASMGRFMPQKGFDTLIDALALMENDARGREYMVAAMGSGDYRDWYVKLAREKGVDRRIAFIPFQRDVASVYGAVDAVLMPSRWEAYPLVAAEALCWGVPLIASDCLGLREVAKGTPALTVGVEDPQSLAGAMRAVMDSDRRPSFEAYRGEALKRFDVRNTAESVRRLFVETARKA